jgi:hypothetical protein
MIAIITQSDAIQPDIHSGMYLFVEQRLMPVIKWNTSIIENQLPDFAFNHYNIVIYSSHFATGSFDRTQRTEKQKKDGNHTKTGKALATDRTRI